MYYIISIIVIIALVLILKSYKKVNRLSKEGTLLVAFTKYAKRDSVLGKKIPIEEQYENLMMACYLYNRFCIACKGLRGSYHFSIMENGPVYGKVVDVQLAPFITVVSQTIRLILDRFPAEYRIRIEQYLNDPESEIGQKLSQKAAILLTKDKGAPSSLNKMTTDFINDIMEMDFMFSLFE